VIAAPKPIERFLSTIASSPESVDDVPLIIVRIILKRELVKVIMAVPIFFTSVSSFINFSPKVIFSGVREENPKPPRKLISLRPLGRCNKILVTIIPIHNERDQRHVENVSNDYIKYAILLDLLEQFLEDIPNKNQFITYINAIWTLISRKKLPMKKYSKIMIIKDIIEHIFGNIENIDQDTRDNIVIISTLISKYIGYIVRDDIFKQIPVIPTVSNKYLL